jgi:hypothetical protein
MAKRMKSPAGSTGKKRIFADVMSATEMAAHRRRDGIVLLPLGCFEMHGVHASMDCDTFLVEAACRVLAEEWNAIIMPPLHYTYPGATTPWPGTVSISPRETLDHVIAVTRAILKNGFKKVILVNLHGPSVHVVTLALRSVFEETGQIPIAFAPRYDEFCDQVRQQWGQNHSEAAVLLASLYICGRHGEFDPAATKAQTLEGPKFPFSNSRGSTWKLIKHGVDLPFYFTEPNDHVGRYPGLKLEDAPKLAAMYRKIILDKARGVPEDYDQFQKAMWKAMKAAPWRDMR